MVLARKAGFSVVDVIAFEVQTFGLEKVQEILAKNQLQVSSYIHFDQFATMDANKSSEVVAYGKSAVDIGAAWGQRL